MSKTHTQRVQLSAGGYAPQLAASLYQSHVSKFWYDTGNMALNLALNNRGAGIRGGNAVELAGEPATGKTLTSLKLAADAQKKGGVAFFIDIEGRLDFDFAKSLDVNLDMLYYFGPTKTAKVDGVEQKVSLSHDDVFSIIHSILVDMATPVNAEVPFVIILDSLGMLNSDRDLGLIKTSKNSYKEDNDGKPKNDQGMRAKQIRGWINKVGPMIQTSNGLLVILNHLFDNTDGYSNKPSTRGGRAPKYLASVRIFFTKNNSSVVRDDKDNPLGEKITAFIAKNSVGVPYKSAEIMVMFKSEGGVWVDYYSGIKPYLVANALVEQNGSWFTVAGTDLKFQGEAQLYEALNAGVLKFEDGKLVAGESQTG